MMMQQENMRGFSLIEVNLAIFVVAMGMLTLFSLFPSGLKQAETAHESTQEALFADYVLSTLRAEAALVTAAEWQDMDEFRSMVVADMPLGGDVQHSIPGTAPVAVRFPAADLHMRYILELTDAGNNLRRASLWCRSGQFGAADAGIFKSGAAKYYTEFFYSGMP